MENNNDDLNMTNTNNLNNDKAANKAPIQILAEIKRDPDYRALSEGNKMTYYLVDTQNDNKIYLFSTQKQVERFTDSKGALVKQPNISTHKNKGTLSRNRWLIFDSNCINGKEIFKFK